MKLPLATGLLSAAVLAGCAGSSTQYVMRVDRMYDRSALQQPQVPSDEIPPESYRPAGPADRWQVVIEGPKVVLTAIGEHPTKLTRLEGKEVPSGRPEERRFDLEGVLGGGRFLVHGDDAELTLFGSGVPVVSSERGKLVTR